jgi:hypothetical protein
VQAGFKNRRNQANIVILIPIITTIEARMLFAENNVHPN